ncbi:hypothetical protein AMATHDRAFT_2870 [Amanita thiersii Skay4041]|uniref:Uncharacterized protein n=1 Tax=Amanita thiersii Skay4041 TaxID=703135 RepID=A0A2A9NTG3_9AGAR|nr:hypothetical protein AMATHDRAFT_2870 [Amanita thiersii Skay4041]
MSNTLKEYFEPDQVQLWKVLPRVPARYISKDHEHLSEFLMQFNGSLESFAEAMAPFSLVSDYFCALPTVGHLHLMVQIPVSRDLAAMRRKIIHSVPEQSSTLPSLHDLPNYLDLPLAPSEKIRIPGEDYGHLLVENSQFPEHLCLTEHLYTLFRPSAEKAAFRFYYEVLLGIATSPPADWDPTTTERIFIPFWHRNIASILSVCFDQSKTTRESHNETEIDSFKPDFGLLLDNCCISRGEERLASVGEDTLRVSLAEKVRWVYDPAPYVPGI